MLIKCVCLSSFVLWVKSIWVGDVHPYSYTHSIETMQFLGRSVENNYKTFHKERKLKSKLSAVTSFNPLQGLFNA